MSLKKLDNYELECVAAGVPSLALGSVALGLCGGYTLKAIIDETFDPKSIIFKHPVQNLIDIVMAGATGALLAGTIMSFCTKSIKSA